MRQEQRGAQRMLGRLVPVLLVGYLAAVLLFYFLAGEQLRLRESRGDIPSLPAEGATLELSAGNTVEQRFLARIQRLEEISIQWGCYYRRNAGTVQMQLWDLQNNRLLLSQDFDAAAIPEGGFTTLTAPEPLEGLYQLPLALRIIADSPPGSAASPLMSSQAREGGNEALLLMGSRQGERSAFLCGEPTISGQASTTGSLRRQASAFWHCCWQQSGTAFAKAGAATC